jgi:hypothetical protein
VVVLKGIIYPIEIFRNSEYLQVLMWLSYKAFLSTHLCDVTDICALK